MRVARAILLSLVGAVSIAALVLHARDLDAAAADPVNRIAFSALCVLSALGLAAGLTLWLGPGLHLLFGVLFFGFFAGLMGTNLIAELLQADALLSAAQLGLQIVLMLLGLAAGVGGILVEWRLSERGRRSPALG